MNKYLPFIFVFLIFLVLPLVSSAPPAFQVSENNGIQIEAPMIEFIEANTSFEFHIHAHNFSNGMLLTDNEIEYCAIHIYNPTGDHITQENMSFSSNEIDWEYDATSGNFSELGQHAILFYCEDTDGNLGGFLEYPFWVTPTGDESAFGFQIFLFILLFGLVIFGFFVRNEWVVILGGMGLIALGIFSLTQGISDFRNDLTTMVSLVTIGFGAMISIGTAVRLIEDAI
jgi:hypothetical protein